MPARNASHNEAGGHPAPNVVANRQYAKQGTILLLREAFLLVIPTGPARGGEWRNLRAYAMASYLLMDADPSAASRLNRRDSARDDSIKISVIIKL